MRPYNRGLTLDRTMIYGWLVKVQDKCYIASEPHLSGFTGGKILHHEIWGFREVIPETVGQFLCKDKNGKDVFGKAPCLLHCFSPPKKVYPKWNQEYLRWELWENGTAVMVATEDTYKRHVELIEEKE